MNDPKNEGGEKAHALILLLAPPHSSGNQVIVMLQRTLISFPWFGGVVTSNTRNQVFILASDTRSQLHCFDGLKTWERDNKAALLLGRLNMLFIGDLEYFCKGAVMLLHWNLGRNK